MVETGCDGGEIRARSIALVRERGYGASSQVARALSWMLDVASGELISLTLLVRSARSDVEYMVTYSAARDNATCACVAAQFHRACWHAGLCMLMGREVAWLRSSTGAGSVRGALALAHHIVGAREGATYAAE